MTDRRFPIGQFVLKDAYTRKELNELIQIISSTTADYRRLVENLSEKELSNTYRDDSWNIRQLVHHVADIALVHYLRMKKAITESNYEMTLIDMNAWSATKDALEMPVNDSLNMFESIHHRYAFLAKNLSEEQLSISYFHPVRKIQLDQRQAIAMSAWHAQHHLAHIRLALQ